jgi:hypothetical protein
MRHLRLSKLTKDKTKQNKLRDFTVRGWRVAEVSGIEDLFDKQETAKAQQIDVGKLKYDDIKIGKYIDLEGVIQKGGTSDLTIPYCPGPYEVTIPLLLSKFVERIVPHLSQTIGFVCFTM